MSIIIPKPRIHTGQLLNSEIEQNVLKHVFTKRSDRAWFLLIIIINNGLMT